MIKRITLGLGFELRIGPVEGPPPEHGLDHRFEWWKPAEDWKVHEFSSTEELARRLADGSACAVEEAHRILAEVLAEGECEAGTQEYNYARKIVEAALNRDSLTKA